MNVSGLLALFDHIPTWPSVVERGESADVDPTALHLPRSARAPVLARLAQERRGPLLFVTGRVDAVPIWLQTLEAWLPADVPLLRFPEPTPLPYDRGPWSDGSRNGRVTVLTRLMAGQHPSLRADENPPVIVTSARALLQKTVPKRRFLTALRVLRVGQLIDVEKTLRDWSTIGYERVSVVEAPGHFLQRGGIIDIFPVTAPYPVRVELFGDEIDTVRSFDPATQRSVPAAVDHIVIPPAREAQPSEGMALGERLAQLDDVRDDDLPTWYDDIDALCSGEGSPHLEYYLPLMHAHPASLLDYLPDTGRVIVDDWRDLTQAVRDLAGHAARIRDDQPLLPPDFPSPLFEWDTMAATLANRGALVLGELHDGETDSAENDATPVRLADYFRDGPRFGGQTRPLMGALHRAVQLGERAIVVSRQAQRLAELWRDESRKSHLDLGEQQVTPLTNIDTLPSENEIVFVQGSLAEGFMLADPDDNRVWLNLLTDAEIFGWQRPAPRRRRIKRPIAPETYFSDLNPGDYIVHVEFGVGQFAGLVVRGIGGTEREYLQIRFANDDLLYVPVYHADRISRWMGPGEMMPELSRMGEKRWTKAKAAAQKAVDELADELLDLYAQRELIEGHAFSADVEWQSELEAGFPYQETEDQLQAIADVKRDMERTMPMDRLICGDVGFGKTEVALRAAFKAVLDGKQVAILVPTTILAQQHYNTFRERLSPFPVNVEMLSRFRSHARQQRTIKALRAGKTDIVIGTHRLLSDDVAFKDFGLLIIDEEQRFGVSHKEKLKQLRMEVDVLTMTATPIPRTLHMGLSGLRDVSRIDTPLSERLPVVTYVGQADDTLIRRAILREVDRGGQVFFVHNRVQSIGSVVKKLRFLVPEATFAVGHGQMSERELERVMKQFTGGEFDVLVSTTIVESGLDIPNANTLIVDRAEMFGLAQLYQLRGRVGRGVNRAYAYFFHAPWRILTSDAQARLETIEEHTDLGSGYSIAMRDLEIRGAGELLGGSQSGHIAAVGFDLYTRMLAKAVKTRKALRTGEKVPVELPDGTLIDLPVAAYIPTDYIPDAALRLRLYRRMSVAVSLAEIDDLAAELADRFGPIPDPVDNLLFQLRIKVLAAKAGATAVTTDNGQIRIKTALHGLRLFQVQRYLGDGLRVSRDAVWLSRELATHEWQVRLVQVLEKLGELDREKMKAGDSAE
ncbi:MAG: transcription-repair coupling factor [Anaerolineae bacterium]|nr:transcription-repair coupling factor [Anaerolineae bacterium]